MKILIREIIQLIKFLYAIYNRLLYTETHGKFLSRYMPTKVFGLLENCIQLLNSQSLHLLTRCTWQVEITDEGKLTVILEVNK